MNPKKIKMVCRAYDTMKRLLKEGERYLSKEASTGDRSYAKQFLNRFSLSLSPRFLPASLLAIRNTINLIEELLKQQDPDCRNCVSYLFFYQKSHIYLEMNFFLSESTQRRLLTHFIGKLYVLLQRDPERNRQFKRAYQIIYGKIS